MSASEPEWPQLKLLDCFKERGFKASLITTFNAYLPFYEQVLLPRLVASGCRYNIVLMDARQCSRILAQPDTRPTRAGFSYVLVPVKVPRAFHPKISLLVSPKRGRLIIGSHNLTLAGFGNNRELTNLLEIRPSAADGSKEVATAAFRFVREWLEIGLAPGTGQYLAALDKLNGLVPWLSERGKQQTATRFFGSRPQGPSLWQQVRGIVSADVERATVVGPFFDNDLRFLHRLVGDLRPDSVLVGVEPETAGGFDSSAAPAAVEFRDASCLYRDHGYLHAKAIYLECKDGSAVLITGSANPTGAAWLSSTGGRAQNAEAVLVRQGDGASEAAEALGLISILDRPSLEPTVKDSLRTRSRSNRHEESFAAARVVVALECASGLEIPIPENTAPGDAIADVFGAHQEPLLSHVQLRPALSGTLVLECEEDVRTKARMLAIELEDSHLYALVYHRLEIDRLTRTDRQQRLRQAIDGLEDDEPDLSDLITIIESIIFDESPQVTRGLRSTEKAKPDTEQTLESEQSVESLLVDLAATKKEMKRQRLVNQGDLADLLDLLIYNIGQSLDRTPELGLDRRGRSEEELIGSDDEESEFRINEEEVLEIAGKKVKLLVGRIVKRLRQVATKERDQAQALMQLLAVLALLRHLRRRDLRAN